MCGIFGCFAPGGGLEVKEHLLAETTRALEHRGPDGRGCFVDSHVALVHTRLAFFDLSSGGNQPMQDAQARFTIVYNGEIYNFKELRSQLERDGIVFRTGTDTEVLLYGLIRHGAEFLRRTEGMFSFALYDSRQRTVLIGRDRLGIKPLYYAAERGRVMFSSEIGPLRAWKQLEPNPIAVTRYLQGAEVPTSPWSLFRDVFPVPPGTTLLFEGDSAPDPVPYWTPIEDFDASLHAELGRTPSREISQQLDQLMRQSVEQHMLADVPVGVLCSGGLDSSLLVALASGSHPQLSLFHADVAGRHSERAKAELLATTLGLPLHSVSVTDDVFMENIAQCIFRYESPFSYHPNSVAFLAVAGLVRAHGVKAVLTGEGADEAFLGYANIPTEPIFSSVHRGSDALRAMFHRIPHLGARLWRDPAGGYRPGDDACDGFEARGDRKDLAEAQLDQATHRTFRLLGHHLRTLLHRNDRLGMAHSIEARFPYLHSEVVRFGINLPYKYKVRPAWYAWRERRHPFIATKWALRNVASKHLPRELFSLPKRGFPTSFMERMRVEPRFFHDDCWLFEFAGYSRSQAAEYRETMPPGELVRALQLDVWGELFFRQASPESQAERIRGLVTLVPE